MAAEQTNEERREALYAATAESCLTKGLEEAKEYKRPLSRHRLAVPVEAEDSRCLVILMGPGGTTGCNQADGDDSWSPFYLPDLRPVKSVQGLAAYGITVERCFMTDAFPHRLWKPQADMEWRKAFALRHHHLAVEWLRAVIKAVEPSVILCFGNHGVVPLSYALDANPETFGAPSGGPGVWAHYGSNPQFHVKLSQPRAHAFGETVVFLLRHTGQGAHNAEAYKEELLDARGLITEDHLARVTDHAPEGLLAHWVATLLEIHHEALAASTGAEPDAGN